jgi:hypothetical protein
MTLVMLHDAIDSREDLVTFVRALRQDLRDNPESWENKMYE